MLKEYFPPITVRGGLFLPGVPFLSFFAGFLGNCETVGGVGGVAFSYVGLNSPGSGKSATSSLRTVLAEIEECTLDVIDFASMSDSEPWLPRLIFLAFFDLDLIFPSSFPPAIGLSSKPLRYSVKLL